MLNTDIAIVGAVSRARRPRPCSDARATTRSSSIPISTTRRISVARSSMRRRSSCCARPGSRTLCFAPQLSTSKCGSDASATWSRGSRTVNPASSITICQYHPRASSAWRQSHHRQGERNINQRHAPAAYIVRREISARLIVLASGLNLGLRHQLGILGDVFSTSCPAAGTGCNKVFTDVVRLCNVHIPVWLASAGMEKDKIDAFYDDEIKIACDRFSADKALYLRSFSTQVGLDLSARRYAKFLAHLGKGKLRQMGEQLALNLPILTALLPGSEAWPRERRGHATISPCSLSGCCSVPGTL